MKRKIILVAITLAGLLAFWLLFSYSFIEVSLGQGENFTISYTDQQSSKEVEVSSAGGMVKRLVRRGNHEVLVRHGDSSYFAVVRAKGLLSTTSISPTLSKEKARGFIGNNPSPCMQIISGILLSSACGDRIDQLQVHVPATASQPTFSRKSSSPFNGFMEGTVKTAEGTIVVIKAPQVDEDEGPPHGAYLLDSSGNISNGVALEALDPSAPYLVTSYRGGFLAYSSDSDQAYYYENLRARPTTIGLKKPKNTSLRLQSVDTHGDTIFIIYSNTVLSTDDFHESGEVHSDVVTETKNKPLSEVVVQQPSASYHHSFSLAPNNIRLCASDRLCLLKDGVLEVFDIAEEKKRSMFKVVRVISFESADNALLVIRANEILAIDPANQTGTIEYSLGNYTYCGIHVSGNSYVVCAINSNRKRIALLINRTSDNLDSIDKKISGLLESPDIKDVSVYGRFIHISPNVGEVKPHPQTGFFEYDRTLVGQVNARIFNKIDELGINRNTYTIVNAIN